MVIYSKKRFITIVFALVIILMLSTWSWWWLGNRSNEVVPTSTKPIPVEEYTPEFYQYANSWEFVEQLEYHLETDEKIEFELIRVENSILEGLSVDEVRCHLNFKGDLPTARNQLKRLLEDERYIVLHQVILNPAQERLSVECSLFNRGSTL